MTTTTLFIILVTVATAVFWIALPFLTGPKRERQGDYQVVSEVALESQLGRLVNAIRDLDFDYDTEKIPRVDYSEQRKLLIGRAISAMIQLDEVSARQLDLDQKIEDMVAAYRQQSA